jgi:hypothetical protein
MLEKLTSFQKLQPSFRQSYLDRWSAVAGKETSLEAFASLDASLQALGPTDDERLFFAINLKEKGNPGLAKYIMASLTDRAEPHVGALYESGLLSIIDSYRGGCDYLLSAISQLNTFDPAIRSLFFAAILRGDSETLERLRTMADPEIIRRYEISHAAFIKYLASIGPTLPWRTDENAGLFDLCDISILPQEAVARLLADGKSNLLRIGDGEGAMFMFDMAEELEFASLYGPVRSHMTRRWMGCEYEEIVRPVFGWQQAISDSLSQIDILGCPDRRWMLKTLIDGDARCFVSLLNGWRRIAALRPTMRPDVAFTTTSIVYDLLYHGSLAPLLSGTGRMSIVSWHDLHRPDGFGALGEMRFLMIPPAASDVEALGLTDKAMSVEAAIGLPDRIVEKTVEGETVVICGGYVAKTAAGRLIAGGRRVLDFGSAPEMILVGRPVR